VTGHRPNTRLDDDDDNDDTCKVFDVAKNKVQWGALVNTVLKPGFHKSGEFLD
jgi:hypothetical protein